MTNREIKTLNKAIKELAKNYKADLLNPSIRNPIAHSLYTTWKVFNVEEEGDKH